jgi:hypothetical protein
MWTMMSPDMPSPARFGRPRFVSRRDHLLAEIDALALELEEAREATASGRVPISARADYLRAREAHHRAAIAWMGASDRSELTLVSDALRQCRISLESSRALMKR